MGRLDGKIAIVTGAASGIGEATARTFAREGARVTLTDVQDAKGETVAREIGGVYTHQDVSQEPQWTALIEDVLRREGRLDILVNNAGVFMGATIEDTELELWNRVIAVNLTGVMLGCKHAVRAMKTNPGGPKGSIVNISSITGYIGLANGAAYTASKGGVRLLTKSVAVHCARQYKTIRCNSVHPGAIDTPMNQAAFDASGNPDEMRAFFSSLQPIGRMTTSQEIADACLYLASDESSSVTGAEVLVDGGWLAASGPI
ncbi:MAG: SDR family oxidoreductase [Alphaproteobacteria bacterium]|nr:SDR family oxidoreductase [Alphaproteobacteria bacterium]